MSNEIKGIIYVVLSGLFYGLLGYFGTHALKFSPDVANMLFWRFFIATVVIGVLLLPSIFKRQLDFSHNLHGLFIVFLAGGIFYGSSTWTYFLASQYLGTGVAMIIFFTYPAIVIFCNAFIYRQPIKKQYLIALTLVILGLLFLIELKLSFHFFGVLLSLVSASGYAFYIMASKKYNHLNPLLAACAVCAGCCVFCFLFAALNGNFFMPTDLEFWMHSVGLGIISTALPVLFLLQGLKYICSSNAAILGVLEPIFIAIVGVLLLGETLGALQIIGAIIVLLGAVLSLLRYKH